MFKLVDAKCLDDNLDELASEADVIFTATPQGYLAGVLNKQILSKAKVIDLSADYRLKNVEVYEKFVEEFSNPSVAVSYLQNNHFPLEIYYLLRRNILILHLLL